MSDRRPENPKLLKQHPTAMGGQTGVHSFLPAIVEASPADLIAAVRRGVESGTIKGEVKVARNRLAGWNPVMEVEQPGTYLVIGPFSDGGSET